MVDDYLLCGSGGFVNLAGVMLVWGPLYMVFLFLFEQYGHLVLNSPGHQLVSFIHVSNQYSI